MESNSLERVVLEFPNLVLKKVRLAIGAVIRFYPAHVPPMANRCFSVRMKMCRCEIAKEA